MDTDRLRAVAGGNLTDLEPVGGGDICESWRACRDGDWIFVKSLSKAPPRLFAAEARGLNWLAASGRIAVPAVLGVADDFLVLEWIEAVPPSAALAEDLGRSLAGLHRSGAEVFGRSDAAGGFIGTLPLSNSPMAHGRTAWADFYAEQRIRPYLRTARDRGSISAQDCRAVEDVLAHLADLAGPAEHPARVHGDLWAGNLLWSADGQVRLIDAAAAHGGHRESDLAMLALFGAPYLDLIIAAYIESWPLPDGWRERVALHQLHPVLVHAALFGGSYGARAGRLARAARRAV